MLDIVTPTLNSEQYLEWTLLSTHAMRERGASHVLVDSFSTDRTLQIADRHSVPVLSCPPGSMYAAINLGLRTSSNEWCCYINSDDLIYSKCFFDVLSGAPPDADILYGDIDYIDSSGRYMHGWRSPSPRSIDQLVQSAIMPFPQQSMLFRRRVFEKLSGFNDSFKLSADFDFVARACLNKLKFAKYSSGPMAAFRIHGDQFSQTNASNMRSEVCRSLALSKFASPSPLKFFKVNAEIKLRNLDSYCVRALRRLALDSKISLSKTIEL